MSSIKSRRRISKLKTYYHTTLKSYGTKRYKLPHYSKSLRFTPMKYL